MSQEKAQKFMNKKLQKIKTELEGAVKMHSSQAERIGKMIED